MRSVLVVSGDRLFGEAAAAALTERGWTASFVTDGLTAVASLARRAADALLIVGDDVPRLGAVPLVQQVRRRWPGTTTVVVGTSPVGDALVLAPDCRTEEVLAALESAPAEAVASPERSRDGIAVLAQLTQRQRVVLRLLVEGKDMRAIGEELGLSEHTVRTHMQNLYARLGCHSRLELVRFATAQGLLSGDDPRASG